MYTITAPVFTNQTKQLVPQKVNRVDERIHQRVVLSLLAWNFTSALKSS